MNPILPIAAAALLGAATDPVDRGAPQPVNPYRVPPITALHPQAPEIPTTEVRLGDVAPDFSFQGVDGQWRHLHEICQEGPVLLVFGASDLVLRVLEHERESLLDLGVITVAVVDTRAGAARAMVRRLDLNLTVLADPQGTIAAQFNALDPVTERHRPAWFVLDPERRVMGMGRRKLPLRGYPALAAEALGLPAPGATRPAAR